MKDFPRPIAEDPSPLQGSRVIPTNPYVKFKKEEIDQSIPDRFEQQVRTFPDSLAVKTESQQLTYFALNRFANRVAHTLLARDTKEGPSVALLLDQGAPLVASILGVLKTGKIYVPLDASLPLERNLFIFSDSQADLVITDKRNLSFARELARDERLLINIDEIETSTSAENPGLTLSPDTLAYILYTSGSTGKPKGVVQNHRYVLNNTMKYTNSVHLCADDRHSLLSTCNFGSSIPDLYGALLNGAALLPFNLKEQGLTRLVPWLIREAITIYHSVPAVFRHFEETLTTRDSFPNLRLIKLAGDRVYAKDVELYRKCSSPDCLLFITLGSTEINNVRQCFLNKKTQIKGSRVPVGYEVEDTTVLLLNEAGEEVGYNQVGEITIKSQFMFQGYWRRPDLTRAAFLSNSSEGEDRLFRTGDMGRLTPDGCLTHLGRKDFQVKIRGYRVEVGEIEVALLEDRELKEAVVVGQEGSAGDQRLVAYVVPATGSTPTANKLRRFLMKKLPDYMVPTAFVVLPALPLTPNRKIDRHALPSPPSARPDLDKPYQAPRTPLEEALAGVWAKLLDLDQVGIHDKFLELGGHSILAMQIVSQVLKKYRVELSLQALFRASTVADMAVEISNCQAEKAN